MPERRELSIALQVAGFRPETASNQVRIPVAAGRDAVEVAIRALEVLGRGTQPAEASRTA
jgi:hypothetical protein